MKLNYYNNIYDNLYWYSSQVPTLYTGTTFDMLNTQIAPGKSAINVASNRSFYAWQSGITEYITTANINLYSGSTVDLSGYYTSAQTNALYVYKAGDTMTGNLTITPLSAATERIITTSGTGLLQNYLQTDNLWVTNATIISALYTENNWTGGTYGGTTTGLVEGQMYVGVKYFYIYQNSTVNRINIATDFTRTITATATANTYDNFVISSASTSTGYYLYSAVGLNNIEMTISNMGDGLLTVYPANSAQTINNESTQVLSYLDSMNILSYNNSWIIK